jgi:fucose 4-O-acetylase-like acetyltransferase
MSTRLPQALERPVRTPGAPSARSAPAAPRRPSRRLASAIVLAVVALGLLLVHVDGLPRTRPGSAPASRSAAQAPAAAGSTGRGPAAAAVTALVTARSGQGPLATAPAGFASVMGYTPVPTRMSDGTIRLAKPTGACSVSGGGAPFGFEQVCKVHDYGYDLLRYAHATGQHLTGEARRQLDAMFGHDLHARCRATRHGLARVGCDTVAGVFNAGVSINSWRQRYGNPAREALPGWTLGLAIPVLAAPLLPRLRRSLRRWRGRLRALADATPAGRDRYVDFLRVASILVVVLGHWTMTAVGRSADGLTAGNLLSSTPWLWLATWVFQVMPVFFFVGGFANMVQWEALRRRGGGYVQYLSGRMTRLLRPVLVFAAVWLALPPALGRLGVPAEQVELVGGVIGQPLWFLGVYLVVAALAPAMVRLHRRFGLWVPAALAVAVAAVDALRLGAGVERAGLLNLLLVWALVQQAGFFYADGSLTRLSRRALAGLAAAGLGGMVVLTGTGLYPPSMVGLPGEESNMSPPTVCILALAVWQAALLMLARGQVSAWLARRAHRAAVIAVGSMAMTVYLWHITAMVALYGLVLAADGPLPAPGTGWWWATRPLWLALLAAVLAPMALLLSRFERSGASERRRTATARAAETPAGRLAVTLGLLLAVLGLFGLVTSGFTPLLDPLRNLACLVAGVLLARAAATGGPWPHPQRSKRTSHATAGSGSDEQKVPVRMRPAGRAPTKCGLV